MIFYRSRLRQAALTLALSGACVYGVAAAPSDDFKQLAGPASEMNEMHLPAPETLGLRSKAALLPIQPSNADGSWAVQIPVDSAKDLKLMILAPRSEAWTLLLSGPDGKSFDLRADAVAQGLTRQFDSVSFDGDHFPAEIYTFNEARTGLWTLTIKTPETKGTEVLGYLAVSSATPYRLYSYVNTQATVTGRQVGLVASLFDNETAPETGAPTPLAGLREASVRLQNPDGTITEKLMFDDGTHGDGKAGDGVFGNDWRPQIAGRYLAQITARGVTPEGQAVLRTAEHLLQVSDSPASLGRAAAASALDAGRWRIALPVRGLKEAQKVLVYAEVWGRDAAGVAQPVAWLGGLARAERATNTGRATWAVSLALDTRWLGLSHATGSYELRNVRLQDPDYFMNLATADTIAVTDAPAFTPGRSLARQNQITDDMRNGPRPAPVTAPNAVGGKLMLIHGYCSGSNPWPAAQFSSAVVFNDPNANRTHDQFANLIKNFGASLPSFGAVAHSQGGAAALHLYTYYWSGLDYATGPRLIQSVGTPYQGTALAGNLALLGQIFGAGCGANNNLSYSGAAAWLAGIPTASRAKVYFATTSFTDVWWRYDYCNIATDPFLGDPEDGVTEQAYGQLPGGNNRGHKTGWCHTSGMRDPAQTSDTARNAEMNTNAAR